MQKRLSFPQMAKRGDGSSETRGRFLRNTGTVPPFHPTSQTQARSRSSNLGETEEPSPCFGGTVPVFRRNRPRVSLQVFLENDYSFIFSSFAAWSAAMHASIISWMSPFMTLSSLYSVSPMRWSVTRPCGKLYVRIFSERSPVPI